MSDFKVEDLQALVNIELPRDVTTVGWGGLNEALAKIQEANTKASQAAIEMVIEVKDVRKQRERTRVLYEVRRDDLLATDEDVKAGKNREQREAIANGMLKKEIMALEKADLAYRDEQAVLQAVEYALSYLKSTKELIGRQLDIIQKEIDLGLVTPDTIPQ